MRNRWSNPITAAAALAVSAAMQVVPALTQILAVSPGTSVPSPALKTPWGEPDLQGIWTEFDTPLQRPAKYADQELFTEAQREELDKERTEVLNRRAVGTPNDAYNFAVFVNGLIEILANTCAREFASIAEHFTQVDGRLDHEAEQRHALGERVSKLEQSV